MYYCTLKKIESNHSRLRTETVEGFTIEMPIVGQSFCMYSKDTLTPDTDIRSITTSTVQEVVTNPQNYDVMFHTRNSSYMLVDVRLADSSKE